ncbi:MAG: response regulator [Nodosilinea sp.]
MSGKSILLIEHEENLRDVLSDCLSELGGWVVTAATSLKNGLDLWTNANPDVVLVDASTPEPDALILIEKLKQYSITQTVPIVLITAKANWFTLNDFRQMGFAGAINKPFNPSTLSSQVSLLVEHDRSNR